MYTPELSAPLSMLDKDVECRQQVLPPHMARYKPYSFCRLLSFGLCKSMCLPPLGIHCAEAPALLFALAAPIPGIIFVCLQTPSCLSIGFGTNDVLMARQKSLQGYHAAAPRPAAEAQLHICFFTQTLQYSREALSI